MSASHRTAVAMEPVMIWWETTDVNVTRDTQAKTAK